MSSSAKDIQNSLPKMFIYFSELLSYRVEDSKRNTLGKLADLKVKLGELYPKVDALVLRKSIRQSPLMIAWAEVEALEDGKVTLKPEAEGKFMPLQVSSDEMLLRDELLDKQVVDTSGARIEKVNDIHILVVGLDLRVAHVDIGSLGILRRLGWQKGVERATRWLFAYEIPEKMISWKYVQPLASDPQKKSLKLNVTQRKLHEIHPSDLADILEELDQASRSTVFKSLDLQTAAETLEELDPKLQPALIDESPAEIVSDILEEMAPDEATDLLADLPEEQKQKLIQRMEKPFRENVVELLKFEEGTAGSLMTKDFITVRMNKTIGEAIEEFKRTTHPLETVAYLYVVDEDGHLRGVVTLRHLLLWPKDTLLAKLMNPHLITVGTEDGVEKVAEIFKKYKFLAVPVVDKEDRVAGVITLQDMLESKA